MTKIENPDRIHREFRDIIRTIEREVEAMDPTGADSELQEALELIRDRVLYPVVDDEREYA